MDTYSIERELEDCVDVNINVPSSLVDRLADEINETLSTRIKQSTLTIEDGYLLFDGFKLARFIDDVDVIAINSFKDFIGSHGSFNHIKNSK